MRTLSIRQGQLLRQKRARELGQIPKEVQDLAIRSQAEVGKILGISPQMVAIIEQSAMRKLRAHFLQMKLKEQKTLL